MIFNFILHFFIIITNWKYRISGIQIKEWTRSGKLEQNSKSRHPVYHAQFTRSWILLFFLQPLGLTIKPKNVCFLPKCNLRPSLGVQRSLWGHQKSKTKAVTASFLRPLAVKDPVDWVRITPPVHPSHHTCPVSRTFSMKYQRSHM